MSDVNQTAALRELPSIGALIDSPLARELALRHGRDFVRETLRALLEDARRAVLSGQQAPASEAILTMLGKAILQQKRTSLLPVINATGIVLHTNLGRAPLGQAVIAAIGEAASGYCNLEFDLEAGRRGERTAHAREVLRLLTNAEDAVVVNNNAAALFLALSVLAQGKEVIVSRGELIEIGGSFRLPDIMAASGARMVEVGTTNRTRLSDYEKAIGPDTALLFKAHRSNFAIIGFTEEASVQELAGLARVHGLPLFYDQGCGLLRRPEGSGLDQEPDVRSLLADGADLVSFSGDKLLGGPQAGILVGGRAWVQRLAKAPLMRALRVDKLTYAALIAACLGFLCPAEEVEQHNPAFAFLSRTPEELRALAEQLQVALAEEGIASRVVASGGQCGGGALPGVVLPSAAVEIQEIETQGKDRFTERLHVALMGDGTPVLSVLREGRLLLDVLALFPAQIPLIAQAVARGAKAAVAP